MTQQPTLPLSVPDVPVEESPALLSRNPDFTGVRFRELHAQTADEIVRQHRAGATIAGLARIYACSRNTIAALLREAAQALPVDQQKKEAAIEYRELAALGRDRMREVLVERPESVPFRDLAVSVGIMEDKAAQVSGTIPLAFVLVPQPVTIESYEERLSAARIGLGGETAEQKGAQGEGRGELGEGRAESGAGGRTGTGEEQSQHAQGASGIGEDGQALARPVRGLLPAHSASQSDGGA